MGTTTFDYPEEEGPQYPYVVSDSANTTNISWDRPHWDVPYPYTDPGFRWPPREPDQDVKNIEYYEDGTIKKVEYYPKNRGGWELPPVVT